MADQNQEAALTKSELEQFENGTKPLNSFSADKQARISRLIQGEDIPVVDAPAEPAVKTTPDTTSEPAAKVESKEEIPKDFVPGKKFKEKADEANTYKQRADSYAAQLEETRAQLELIKKQKEITAVAPVKDPNELFSDRFQMDQAQRIANLERMVLEGVKGSQEKLEKLERELADKALKANLNAFAAEFPELRLSRPFEEANDEYIQFTQKLGATPSDLKPVDRYFEDAAFRKEMEAKGIKPPKDYDRLSVILKTYHKQKELGYPTPRAAYLDVVLTPDEMDKRLRDQYARGSMSAVEKIANNRNETALLEPGNNSSESSINMTEPQMEAWMKAHPYPTTPNDKAIMAQIQAYVLAQSRS